MAINFENEKIRYKETYDNKLAQETVGGALDRILVGVELNSRLGKCKLDIDKLNATIIEYKEQLATRESEIENVNEKLD